MATPTIVHPVHYRIVERGDRGWSFHLSSPCITLCKLPTLSLEELFATFDLTVQKVATELFRINGGKAGYYLANIKDKQYYYCGKNWEDVKAKLIEVGIGRPDPVEV